MKTFIMLLSLSVFSIVVWIVVPAPAAFFWLVSIGAGEWSLWFAALSFLIIALSILALIFTGEKIFLASAMISIFSSIIALYPFFSSLKTARAENVPLSVGEYLSGLKFGDRAVKFETRTFADIDGRELKMDVYAPLIKNDNNGAAVISVHGGGWNARTRNDFPQWNEWLAANGFTVFDIDYRLAPQPNYLTATADVKCAVLFIKQNAAEFNISPDRIALFGRSAGGHLALLAAYSAGDSRLSPGCAANNQTENVRAVVSIYSPVELVWAYDNPANQRVLDGPKTLADFLGGNPHDGDEIRERFLLASPLTHVSNDTPPTFFVHGGKDQLVREENMQFAVEKLTAQNIAHKTIFIPYAQHGFDFNIHGIGSQIIKPAMLEFLKENTEPK